MPGYDSTKTQLNYELIEAAQEGKDPVAIAEARAATEAAGGDESQLRAIKVRLDGVKMDPAFPFQEPNGLEEIRTLRKGSMPRREVATDDALLDRLYGAWLGRCSGCALGKPAEALAGWMGHHLESKSWIKTYLQAVSPAEWPLRDYFPAHSPAETETLKIWGGGSTREKIAFMESDDDIRYTVINQLVLKQHGLGFTSRQVGWVWLTKLPFGMVCTAETQAYRNMAMWGGFHHNSPEELDFNWVATNDNPYREWIGAQIRADSWGYAAPGNPELAAEMAWRDGRISHVKNGIYGEMYIAAMIAAALVLRDPLAIVEAGLGEIPATSRLHAAMRRVIDICRAHDFQADQFESVHDAIYRELGQYHPAHTINNAGLVTAALLLGKQDFERVITIAVMGGWDTDCNGATAGSIAGAMLGAAKLPAKWIAPLHDRLESEVIGYHPISITQCAQNSLDIIKAGVHPVK